MRNNETPFEDENDEATIVFPGPGDTFFPGLPNAVNVGKATGQDWYDYTTGYKEAADILVAHTQATGRRYDKLGYPILFLYRQHLELVIKSLILTGCNLLGRSPDFPKHHHLDQLWRWFADLLREIQPNASGDEVKEITRLLDEFCKVDPKSLAFRYPGLLLEVGSVYLNDVHDVVGKISFCLECIEASLNAENDA